MTRHSWYLTEALQVVRDLQPLVRDLDYHIALGGGVLNNGFSDKDIDLYILPVFKNRLHRPDKVVDVLFGYFKNAAIKPLIGGSAGNQDDGFKVYSHQQKWELPDGRRVDVFIARGI